MIHDFSTYGWRLLFGLMASFGIQTGIGAAEKNTDLQVSTNFPSGSGEVESIDQHARTIHIKPATHPDRGWDCWWFFKVTGIKPGETIAIDLGRGATGGDFALADQATFSTDGASWQHTAVGERHGERIFYRQRVDSSTAWFAWGPPFTGDNAKELIDAAVKKCKQAEAFELCRSAGDRPVLGLHIPPLASAQAKKLPVIWITARQHAWESGGSWVCRGLAEWLVSDDARAVALRSKADFYFVPIVDIDNVTLGAGGKEEPPQDHNRDWTDQPHHPAVAALQKEMLKLDKAGRLSMFIDLHNPSPADKSPYFLTSPRSVMSAETYSNVQKFLQAAQAEMTGPLKFRGDIRESGPNYDARWKQIGKNWVTLHSTGPVVSVTLETAWNTPDSTTEGYTALGRQLGLAIEKRFALKK